jgi:hypothetical protein
MKEVQFWRSFTSCTPLPNFPSRKFIGGRWQGRKSGNPTKRHLSLRRFQKTLGVAPSQESSGDISKSKVSGGSAICWQALWQWVFSAVEPKKRRTNALLTILGQFLDAEKAAGKPVKLVRMRVAVKAVKILFKKLVLSQKVLD